MDREFGAGLLAVNGDRMSRIVDAEGSDRPAVIGTPADQVQLIAALRAMLVRPQLAGRTVEGEALRVAVAIAPNFGPRTFSKAERIVVGDRPVGANPDDRTSGGRGGLSFLAFPTVREPKDKQ